MSDLPAARCGLGNDPEHRPHDYAVTGEWPASGPHRHCPGGPTTGEQTPDVEALAEVIESGWEDEPTPAESELADTVARDILASDWLAARDGRVAAEALRAAAQREAVEVYSPALRVRAVLVDALLERAERVEAGDE